MASEDAIERQGQRYLRAPKHRANVVISVFLLAALMNGVQLASFYSSEPSLQLVFKHSLNGNQNNRILQIGASKEACQHVVFRYQSVALPDKIRQRSDPSLEDDPFNHVVENRSPTSRRGSRSRASLPASSEGHFRGKRGEVHVEIVSRVSPRGIRSEKSRPAFRQRQGKHDDEPFPSENDVRRHAYVSSK